MSGMSDKELLELAAKAAGIEIFFGVEWHDVGECYTGSRALPRSWNPLTDDGDALRLAHSLEMTLETGEAETLSDLRRDIVRAAAAREF